MYCNWWLGTLSVREARKDESSSQTRGFGVCKCGKSGRFARNQEQLPTHKLSAELSCFIGATDRLRIRGFEEGH